MEFIGSSTIGYADMYNESSTETLTKARSNNQVSQSKNFSHLTKVDQNEIEGDYSTQEAIWGSCSTGGNKNKPRHDNNTTKVLENLEQFT